MGHVVLDEPRCRGRRSLQTPRPVPQDLHYTIERFIEPADHPRHVCLVCIEDRETLTVGLSALLDGKLFERAEV